MKRAQQAKTGRIPAKGADATDAYLATLPAEQRAALQSLRAHLLAAAPGAVEEFGDRLPVLRVGGRTLVYYGASAKHCALYTGSMTATAAFAKELAGFKTTTGSILFQPDKPLSAALVRRIVAYRIAEEAASASAKQAKRGKRSG